MGETMTNTIRHIYWLRNARWWRGADDLYVPVIPYYAEIEVTDFQTGEPRPAYRTSHLFIEWNKPATLHEFICRVLWKESRFRSRPVTAYNIIRLKSSP